MSEFDAARERYERKQQRLGKQSADMGRFFERPILHLPKQKSPKISGRHNEIDVEIYVNGRTIMLSYKVDFTGNLIGSQLTDASMSRLVWESLSAKFGKVMPL